MKTKSMVISLAFVLLLVSVVVIVYAEESPWPAFNVCCEKTKSGAWCQNVPDGNCDSGFRQTPTSCDATSYCKLGCCVDSGEGLCMENTPQKVCEVSSGTWLEDENCQVPQCSLGCCVIGDQASFVTLTRCKRLSSLYGLQTNYRTDLENEAACILTAYSSDRGACVFEEGGSKTCKMTTRGECQGVNRGNSSSDGDKEFFENYLCSADELATECGPTTQTTCLQGKHEVYFKDSCGNPANIYDANRIYTKDPGYWNKIVPKSESCSPSSNDGNAGSRTCGNCDYLSGSICKKGNAAYGDLACKDLNCYNTKNGNNYRNGESWCIYQSNVGKGQDTVGSRHYRHICIHGEEIIEPCADFRNEVCYQDVFDTSKGNFNEAACRPNRWSDCIDQLEKDDCENTDKRDCYWVKGVHYDGSSSQTSADQKVEGTTSAGVSSNLAEEDPEKENFGVINEGGICLPEYPPGLEFWQESNAGSICGLGNSRQTVHFTDDFFGDRECEENCDILSGSWVNSMNGVCLSLGDCGNYQNILGVFTDDGIVVKDNGKKEDYFTRGCFRC